MGKLSNSIKESDTVHLCCHAGLSSILLRDSEQVGMTTALNNNSQERTFLNWQNTAEILLDRCNHAGYT